MKRSPIPRRVASLVTALALGCGVAPALAAGAAPAHRHEAQAEKPIRTIAIAVNGDPLETATPPQVVRGRLLVPLREVFDALGIVVTRAGTTISARLPTAGVRFNVGSSTAYVDDRPVPLGGPVVDINGSTYAPLTLLTAVFGAQATYDQRAARVEIVSAYIGRNSTTEQARSGGGIDVQGVVSAVDVNSSPPSITVVRGGGSRTVSVTSDAKIWTEDVTIRSQLRGALADVRVGDAVHAILARDGRVVSVFDFYKSTSGTVAALSPSALVLGSGRVVTPAGSTEISLNSAAAHLSDLKVGDYVTVRSNPESGELRQIVASRPLGAQATPVPATAAPGARVAIASVELSTARPLRAGESFDVIVHGTPGGRARFDIGDYLTDLPMRESSPGVYVAHFTVPDRFNVTQVPVYGKLSVGGNSAPRTEATQTLSAATTSPRIDDVAPLPGQTVNNVRPSIFATFSAPTEIAIDLARVKLEVNGLDVTSSATRTSGFVVYPPGVDLPEGPVTVVVRVSDSAGNTSSRSWNFTIRSH